MKCDIYKPKKEPVQVLIVRRGTKPEDVVSESVLAKLGELSLEKSMSLSPSTPLVGVVTEDVIKEIKENDYFSTIESTNSHTSSVGAGIGTGILVASLGFPIFGSLIAGAVAALIVDANAKEKK